MKERFETFTVLINRISRNIRKIKIREMTEYNLRSAHISCLYYIYKAQSITATELCERCEEDKATISRALDYLEKNQFITYDSPHAKRYKCPLHLTDKGTVVGKKIADKVDGVLDEIGKLLSEQERDDFYHALSTISRQLESFCKSDD